MYCSGLGSSTGGLAEAAEAGLQYTDTSVGTVQDWGAVQEDRLRLLKKVCSTLEQPRHNLINIDTVNEYFFNRFVDIAFFY